LLPARSPLSPRTHWRNPRPVRRRASGRSVAYNLRFPGQIFDGQAGLHYNYYRDYDPAAGRYVESDPIGLGGGINTFVYVIDDPLGFLDAFGLDLTPAQQAAVKAAALDWVKARVPYVYGGATKLGADCSGSISGVFRQAGIDIGRLSSQAFRSGLFSPAVGPHQIGDIAVYDGHVAIYGGDTGVGKDVWSASHTGGPPFGPANSSWYGTPTWYRYNGP